MHNHSQTRSISNTITGRTAALFSPETRRLLTLGQKQGWDSAVLGRAPLPEEPVRLGDWLIVPALQDTSPVLARALERVQTIFAAGLRPKGFVVVHEAPMLLSPPEKDKPEPLRLPLFPGINRVLVKRIIGGLILGLILLVTIVGVLALALAALAVVASLLVPATLVAGAVVVDPILIAVTEDGYWIEIDCWWS